MQPFSMLFVTKVPAFLAFPRPFVAAFLTCCRCEHICGVSEPHEIKLVKPPVFLVWSFHWVSLPLVHNLVPWVAVWKPHRERVRCVKERGKAGEKDWDKSWRQRIQERLMQQCSFYCMHDLYLIYAWFIQIYTASFHRQFSGLQTNWAITINLFAWNL